MKIIITGANGQLGKEVVLFLKEKDCEVFGYGRRELDITNQHQVNEVISSIKPDIVIHAAAYTQVDQAESELDSAYLVNAIGTRNVAAAAHKVDAKLLYISTDYVFDGMASEPIDEFQPTNPQNVYGKTKLVGEQFVKELHNKFFIVRTSWVYGEHGNNFVKTMLKLAETLAELKVVDDQLGSPTNTRDLAEKLYELMLTEKYGTYHISGEGQCSWYEFACEIFKLTNKNVIVKPCSTEEFPKPAVRPKYSVLKNQMNHLNGLAEMKDWKESLERYLKLK